MPSLSSVQNHVSKLSSLGNIITFNTESFLRTFTEHCKKTVSKLAWLQPSPVWRFILWVHAKSLQLSLTLCDLRDCPWDSPGKNTGVGCHAFLQGSSWSRTRTTVSMSPELAGRFFTSSATWEAPYLHENLTKQFLFSIHFLIIFP